MNRCAAADGSPIGSWVCARLTAPTWNIRDAFTLGLGGERHLDLYLGEEAGPAVAEDPLSPTPDGATVERLP